MRVIVFNGSPRIGGNTDLLVSAALKGIDRALHHVDYFRLNDMDIKPCQNCGGCTDTRVCVIKDKMQQIYPAIRAADRIILASPIYFSGLSAQTKIMIDRCQPFWVEKYIHNMPIEHAIHRKGLLILVGGMKRQIGADCSAATATAFFRSISVEEHKTLAYLGIDNMAGIRNHPTALQDTYEAARRLTVR
ncbi:MAG: flavodoxin family protein [Syntrophorhabdus sp.]